MFSFIGPAVNRKMPRPIRVLANGMALRATSTCPYISRHARGYVLSPRFRGDKRRRARYASALPDERSSTSLRLKGCSLRREGDVAWARLIQSSTA